ncbi:hypothetical protein [Thermosipho ferrireducens]|nr:hypothetical protein [Thermosipho ferrireducens]
MRKTVMVFFFLMFLLLATFVFADKTDAGDSTHGQTSVIEQRVDG